MTIWNPSGFDLSNINHKWNCSRKINTFTIASRLHVLFVWKTFTTCMVLDMACHTSVYNITHGIAAVNSLTLSLLPRYEVAYVRKIWVDQRKQYIGYKGETSVCRYSHTHTELSGITSISRYQISWYYSLLAFSHWFCEKI